MANILLQEKLIPQKVISFSKEKMAEYITLASEAGLKDTPSTFIEEFKQFLNDNDIPVYNLTEVVKYMDEKARKESKEQSGWEWKPIREQDHLHNVSFGRSASRMHDGIGRLTTISASDYYKGSYREGVYSNELSNIMGGTGLAGNASGSMLLAQQAQANLQHMMYQQDSQQFASQSRQIDVKSPIALYDYDIPMHALKKVALITKAFGNKVAMFVSDYTLAPAIQYPDPFLMAVISNSRLNKGVGRFVIDFWSEPGFGLELQLK